MKFVQFSNVVVASALLLMGCKGGIGEQAIDAQRARFNDVVQDTSEKQLFVNLIRVHQNHTPFFMDVSEIDDSISISGNVSGGPSGLGAPAFIPSVTKMIKGGGSVASGAGAGTGVSSSVMGMLSYTDSPTIRYVPLTGQALVSQLATPITVDSIQELVDSGWNIRSVLDMSAERLTLSGDPKARVLLLNNIEYLHNNHFLTLAAIKWPPPGSLMPTSTAETVQEVIGYQPPSQQPGQSISATWNLSGTKKRNPYDFLPFDDPRLHPQLTFWGGLEHDFHSAFYNASHIFGNILSLFESKLAVPCGATSATVKGRSFLFMQSFESASLAAGAGGGTHGGGGSGGGSGSGGGGGGGATGGASAGGSGGQQQQGGGATNAGNDTIVLYCDLPEGNFKSPECQAWIHILDNYASPSDYFFTDPKECYEYAPWKVKFLRLPTVPTTRTMDASVSLNTFTKLQAPPIHMRSAMGVLLSSTQVGSWAFYLTEAQFNRSLGDRIKDERERLKRHGALEDAAVKVAEDEATKATVKAAMATASNATEAPAAQKTEDAKAMEAMAAKANRDLEKGEQTALEEGDNRDEADLANALTVVTEVPSDDDLGKTWRFLPVKEVCNAPDLKHYDWVLRKILHQHQTYPYEPLIAIYVTHSPVAPPDAYVSYSAGKGIWFYIKSDDSESQRNYMLLSLLMTIQSGPPSVSPLTPTFNVGIGH